MNKVLLQIRFVGTDGLLPLPVKLKIYFNCHYLERKKMTMYRCVTYHFKLNHWNAKLITKH